MVQGILVLLHHLGHLEDQADLGYHLDLSSQVTLLPLFSLDAHKEDMFTSYDYTKARQYIVYKDSNECRGQIHKLVMVPNILEICKNDI